MDLDLAQVRAFLAVAERLHFGRAAEQLSLSQQALSKRVARLEAELGAALFLRGGHAVELTEAGHRFLEPARRALAAGDRAVAAARDLACPLRLDAWGHLFGPMRTLRPVLARLPELTVEVGAGRDLPGVADALVRSVADVGFGRVYRQDSDDAVSRDLTHRLVRLEPVDLVVGPGHPLADRSEVRTAELRDAGVLWSPAAVERLEFYVRLVERFGVTTESSPANLGLEHYLEQVAADPRRYAVIPADLELPGRLPVRPIPLVDPTPLYAWSLLWRSSDTHPGIETLLRTFADVAAQRRWLEYRPGQDWLPAADAEDVALG
ncbi:LysR family transcriptional regulator [Catenulispora yoronensis]|uniref:LysR family transcriptional regulator n=1 Tax=Catenulispora yoronensis TaxID=450799 RepID=A0ABN2V0J6_9ACTN